MNRDLKGTWQHLKAELQHWNRAPVELIDWVDAKHDYTRGRVAVEHGPRMRRIDRASVKPGVRRLTGERRTSFPPQES